MLLKYLLWRILKLISINMTEYREDNLVLLTTTSESSITTLNTFYGKRKQFLWDWNRYFRKLSLYIGWRTSFYVKPVQLILNISLLDLIYAKLTMSVGLFFLQKKKKKHKMKWRNTFTNLIRTSIVHNTNFKAWYKLRV